MRRVLGLLAAIGLLATFPTTVAAAEPLRASDWQTGIFCELSSDAGFVSVFADFRESGAFADVAIWGPDADPFSDPPSIVTAQGTAALDGSRLSATFDLVLFDNPEKAAGSARITAELAPAGPEEDFGSTDLRDGNRIVRIEQTLQLLSVSGSLALQLFDGIEDEVDLAPCGASTFASTFFSTNPNAYLTGGDQLFISCEWMTKAGAISLLAINDKFGAFSELVIGRGDGVLVGLAVPVLSVTTYQASQELFDPAGGGETVGTATADAALSPSGDRITDQESVGPYRLSTVGERLAVDGALTLSVGSSTDVLAMDDASCRAGDVRVQVMEKIPHG